MLKVIRSKSRRKVRFCVEILWGCDKADARERGASYYEFETEDRLDAFLYGVDEAGGWLEYEIERLVVDGKVQPLC